MEKHHLRPFPALWCDGGAGNEQTMGSEEHSEHRLPVHRYLNHSFKATQLKSGSFRVTVDGVPKALDILHKEKITCQLVKAVTKKDVGQVTRTSQKCPVNQTKTQKRADRTVIRDSSNILVT